MARTSHKAELPSKICLTCGLPFNWRKKWAREWDNVRYCSERCRRSKSSTAVRKTSAKNPILFTPDVDAS